MFSKVLNMNRQIWELIKTCLKTWHASECCMLRLISETLHFQSLQWFLMMTKSQQLSEPHPNWYFLNCFPDGWTSFDEFLLHHHRLHHQSTSSHKIQMTWRFCFVNYVKITKPINDGTCNVMTGSKFSGLSFNTTYQQTCDREKLWCCCQ